MPTPPGRYAGGENTSELVGVPHHLWSDNHTVNFVLCTLPTLVHLKDHTPTRRSN